MDAERGHVFRAIPLTQSLIHSVDDRIQLARVREIFVAHKQLFIGKPVVATPGERAFGLVLIWFSPGTKGKPLPT